MQAIGAGVGNMLLQGRRSPGERLSSRLGGCDRISGTADPAIRTAASFQPARDAPPDTRSGPMIVTTRTLFEHAYGKYALGAYNINNLEQIMGLFQGNIDSNAPFIIQLSKGARSYTDKRMLEAIIRAAEEVFPQAVFAVHLDHGDEQTCYECIESGFYSSVMIDASHRVLPDGTTQAMPFAENVAITARVVEA